jgi:hypothetical protein
MIVVMFFFGWFLILCETTNKVQCLGLLYFFLIDRTMVHTTSFVHVVVIIDYIVTYS